MRIKQFLSPFGEMLLCLWEGILLCGSSTFLMASEPADDEVLAAILYLNGAATAESLDPQTMERFEHLHAHPLKINLAPAGKMMETGLFTSYQYATLRDYQDHHGDILSLWELATIDGFGPDYARALAPFLDFSSSGMEPHYNQKEVEGQWLARGAWTRKGWSEGTKFKLEYDERWQLAFSASNTTGHPLYPVERVGFHLAYYGRSWLGKVMVGDFNARFGQGLGLWSGFSIRGFSNYLSFYRRPTGLSPSWSWSDANFRGVAADFHLRRWVLSTAVHLPALRPWMEGKSPMENEFMPLLNLAYNGRHGQFSLTGVSHVGIASPAGENRAVPEERPQLRLAADFRLNLKGHQIFGETSFDVGNRTVAAVGGMVFNLAYQSKLSWVGRYYPAIYFHEAASPISMATHPQDEWGIGVGWDHRGYLMNLDFARHPAQEKSDFKFSFQKEWGIKGGFSIAVRATERLKLPFQSRAGLRVDWKYTGLHFLTTLRTEASYAEALGALGYLESGYKTERTSAYCRVSLFRADHWEDRIYAYERDAPGNFNVPAYYGRGVAASANIGHRIPLGDFSLKIYLRAGMVQIKEKPGKAELKLQISFDF